MTRDTIEVKKPKAGTFERQKDNTCPRKQSVSFIHWFMNCAVMGSGLCGNLMFSKVCRSRSGL